EGKDELGWWRDRFGRIPWQHACSAEVLASTDPDALRRQLPGAGARPERLADFLSGGLSNDRADFSLGVERLRPGELAHRHNDRPLGVQRWWSPTWRCGASDQPATTHVRDQRLDTLGGLLRRNA